MDVQALLSNIHDLTDLELAFLLSLISQQNILITTEDTLLDDLTSELALIASEVFRLSYAVVSAEDLVSVDKFGEAILDQTFDHDFGGFAAPTSTEDYVQPHSRLASVNIRAGSIAPSRVLDRGDLDSRTVANVVIAKNFNLASRDVQVAALELITRRRIYSRTTVHQVPKVFLFVPVVSTSTKGTRLNSHLNDRISISHHHDPADGFANLEELSPDFDPDYDNQRSTYSKSSSSSTHSVINHRRHDDHPKPPRPKDPLSQTTTRTETTSRQILPSTISSLRSLGESVSLTPEIRRHIQDIIVFLRIARGVDGGVTPFATTQFVNLAKYLAPLHGLDFVTPSLVALAARKIYPHRIVIASPDRERSMQWGSDIGLVEEMLDTLTPEKIIEEVLATVPSPV